VDKRSASTISVAADTLLAAAHPNLELLRTQRLLGDGRKRVLESCPVDGRVQHVAVSGHFAK
jgi:hypothetical protein